MTKTIRLLLALALLLPTKLHSQLIADHTIVEDYAIIPEYYRNEVKKMLVSIPGASHSTAYRLGLQFLEELDARFAVNIAYEESYTENHLRCNRIGRDFLDDEWYTWFAWPDGQRPAEANSVKDMIRRNYENNRNLAAIGYGWCWIMMSSYHSREYDPEHNVRWWGSTRGGPDAGTLGWGLDAGDFDITGNRVNLDTYLEATLELMEYCRTNNYPTKVLFTTGPVDKYNGEAGYQAWLKHEKIRAFVNEDPDRILFDYADILCYNTDGSTNTESYSYEGVTYTYPFITDINLGDEAVGHIGREGALRLGKAMWWLLARIAGWDGISTGVSTQLPPSPSDFNLTQHPGEIQILWTENQVQFTTYSLFNTTGTCVLRGTMSGAELNISTSHLPAGVYILQLEGDLKAHRKLVLN